MKKLDNFLNELKKIFPNRLKSVFIYGAKAHLEPEELDNDINLMVITDTLNGEDIKKVSAAAKKWMGTGLFDKKNPEPVFMGENEWMNSSDVYAMEYSDIIKNHKILYGENLICSINVKKEDLRLQCEAETKNLLMRFRSHYLLNADSVLNIQKSIVPVTKSFIAIFKAILELNDITVQKSPYEIINKIHEITAIDKKLFEKLLCIKENHCKLNKKETYEISDRIISELTKLLEYVNNI